MRYILTLLCLILPTCCQQPNGDEAKVKSLMGEIKAALISRDASSLEPLLSQDVVIYDISTQETTTGNDKAAHMLVALFSDSNIEDLSITLDTIKAKDSLYHATGKLTLHIPNQKESEVAFSADFEQSENKWQLESLRMLLITPPPSHYSELKELDWLTGSWKSSDSDSAYTTTFSWDLNKNFIDQEFDSLVFGYKQLTGRQYIGWNPVDKQITSWIFDSDGGYGHSNWWYEDGSWYATTSYILHDGRKSSATHIIKMKDKDSYLFSSISRDVEGRVLPNIGPFTIVRTKGVK